MKQAHSNAFKLSGVRLFLWPILGAQLALLALISSPAFASENRGSILARLEALEQRLSELGDGTGAAYTDPNLDSADATMGAAPSGAGTPHLEVALSQIREEMRDLRGQIEEIHHQNTQLRSSMQRFEKDVDLRLETLERSAQAPAAAMAGDAAVTAPVIAPVIDDADAAVAPTDAPAADDTAQASPTATPAAALNANEAYQSAFDALNSAQYAEAETQFKQFIAQYPKHNLIGNAYYWLGETYYVQQRHEEASTQFRQGFQALPDGPKAPENLLRLGMTLNVMGRQKEACVIIKQLQQRYKDGSQATLRKAARESDKIGCN